MGRVTLAGRTTCDDMGVIPGDAPIPTMGVVVVNCAVVPRPGSILTIPGSVLIVPGSCLICCCCCSG